MRKYQKIQCLDLIHTIKEGVKNLGALPDAERLDVLQTGQEGAIALGSLIEEQEGEGHPVIPMLEDFCELMYGVYSGSQEDKGRVYQKAVQIERRMQKEIKDMAEILFLPVSADDWRVMEGVYRRALGTAECAVSVVSVPVQIMDSNGRPVETYDDRARYPRELTVTDCREYDLAVYRPDVIFMSGLAEKMEIGQVAEGFSCRKLKKYSEKLVYLAEDPGVYGENCGRELKNPEIFWRRFVLDRFRPDAGESGGSAAAGGKGCFDSNGGEPSGLCGKRLPDSWKEKIGGKKVILADWGLHDAVRSPGRFLERLEEAAEEAGKNGAVLWWRMNPMISCAFRRESAARGEAFEAVIARLCASPSVIVDSTSDDERAAGYADAFLGSAGRGLSLAGVRQIPVCVASPFEDRRERNCVTARAAVAWKGQVFLSADRFNGLYRLDIMTGQLEALGEFPGETRRAAGLHTAAAVCGNFAYFIPGGGDVVTEVDLETFRMRAIPLPEETRRGGKEKFTSAAVDGKNLWMLPGDGGILVKLDMETGIQTVCGQWPEKYDFQRPPFRGGAVAGGRLWLCPYHSGSLVSVDLQTGRMGTVDWGLQEQTFSGVCAIDGVLWFSPQKGDAILKMRPETMEYKYIEDFPLGFWSAEDRYSGICCQDEAVWLIPHHAGAVLKISLPGGRRTECGREDAEFAEAFSDHRNGSFSCAAREDHTLYLISEYTGDLLAVDTRSGDIKKFSLGIPEDEFLEKIGRAKETERRSGGALSGSVDSDSEISAGRFIADVCSGRKNAPPAAWPQREEERTGVSSGEAWEEVWRIIR